jgi:hypothetical protein
MATDIDQVLRLCSLAVEIVFFLIDCLVLVIRMCLLTSTFCVRGCFGTF